MALGFALPLEQLGHALASVLNRGSVLEPGAAHSYLAGTVEAAATITGGALLAALIPVALARRAHGRMPRGSAWPFLLLLLGLASIQLELFLAQELAEGGRSLDIVVRGLEGQLPVALVGALVLHWLSARVGPALAALSAPALPVAALAAIWPLASWLPPLPLATLMTGATGARGPPPVLLSR